MSQSPDDRLREHVATWRSAGEALSEVEKRELRAIDTREAVRQLFGHNRMVQDAPRRLTSGLVEQQYWFAKLRLITGGR